MHKLQQKILELSRSENISLLSLRQIGERIGDPQPQKVKHHLDQLFKKGFLKKTDAGINIVEAGFSGIFYSIPVMGSANCGQAVTFADESIESYLTLSKGMLSSKFKQNITFAVKAIGNSMNRASVAGKNIEEGDYVIIDSSERDLNYYNNKYVLSIINGMANIKKFVIDKANHGIALISESSESYPPIYIHQDDLDTYRVNGVITDVIKGI